ncbi:MAG: hypothetical protein ILA13_00435 [Eubacterium sp.]|nr:hypothetical protein [Eubacterium sp.]
MKKNIISIIIAAAIIISACNYSITSEAASGTWKQSGGGWWYEYADGSYAKNEYIDGYWLNSAGWYDSSWNGTWKSNGTGWWFQSGSWYPVSQWLKIDGSWYYFKANGYMAAGEWIGNYYLSASGTMATNTWIGDYYVGSVGAWEPNKTKSNENDTTNSATQTSTTCEHNWVWATKTVHHDQETHTEYAYSQPWDEPVYVTKVRCCICNRYFNDYDDYCVNDSCDGSFSYDPVFDHYIHHDAEVIGSRTFIDKDAYDEVVNDYQYCSKCGVRK